MSTEVERSSQVDSGLTAAAAAAAEKKNQNKSEGAHLLHKEPEEQGQGQPPAAGGQSSEAAKSPTDTHKKCKENDKENERSGDADSASAVEAAKRNVVEAPPPKVNPWTKRTTGRVPPVSGVSPGSQEKGEKRLKVQIKVYAHRAAAAALLTAAAQRNHKLNLKKARQASFEFIRG